MKLRKLLALLLTILLVAGVFAGCGAAPMENGAAMDNVEAPEASPDYGYLADGKLNLDESDDIVSGMLTTKDGKVVHAGALAAMGE